MSEQDTTARKPGRPPGTGVVARLRKAIQDGGKLDEVLDETIELALTRDHPAQMAAIRILLDRAIPVLRAQSQRVKFAIPEGGLTDQAKAVLALAASGDLPIDQVSELITALSRIVSIEQGDELRRMIEELKFGGIA